MTRALDWDAVRRTATELHVRYRGADPVRAVREAVALAEAVEEYRLGYEGCPEDDNDGSDYPEANDPPTNLDLLACFCIVHDARISAEDGWTKFCAAHNVSMSDLGMEMLRQRQVSKARAPRAAEEAS